MAKKREVVKKGKSEKVDFTSIVWCIDNLDESQLLMHDKSPYDDTAIIEGIDKMRESGFSISIKTDEYNDCVMASAACYFIDSLNAGLAIAARGNDLGDTLSILLFKFFIVAEGDLRPFADKKPKGLRG